jgi:hypothetical protein
MHTNLDANMFINFTGIRKGIKKNILVTSHLINLVSYKALLFASVIPY